MEEGFNLVRRRTSDMLQGAQQKLPGMPQLPKLPPTPKMPQLPSFGFSGNGNGEPTMNGTWEQISPQSLPRSSHSLDIVSGNAYMFGGEKRTGEPVDNNIHVITLPWSSGADADYYKIQPTSAEQAAQPDTQKPAETTSEPSEDKTEDQDLDDVNIEGASSADKGKARASDDKPAPGPVPQARYGHATAVIGNRVFVFGGTTGPEAKPLDENGRVWAFNTRTNHWSYLDPVPAVKGGSLVAYPSPRSYHCATASDRPRDFAKPPPRQPQNWRERLVGDTSRTGIPQDPIVGTVAEDAVVEEDEGYGTIFIHGGVLANGDRTTDFWSFDIRSRTWTELPKAPGSGRSSAAITISKSRLFRFGGFDGEKELGGQIDFINLEVEMFDDRASRGEVSLRTRGSWQSILQNNPDASSNDIPVEPVQPWPQPRSGASFHALTIGGGTEYLVLAFGESLPKGAGYEGGGAFFKDVWTFQVPPLGMTPASLSSAVWQAMGRKTGEGRWIRVTTTPFDEDAEYISEPRSRGHLASAVMGDLEESAIFFWGGIGQMDKRFDDGWILRLGS